METTDSTTGFLQVESTSDFTRTKKVTVEEFDDDGRLIRRTITETSEPDWAPIQPVPYYPVQPVTVPSCPYTMPYITCGPNT